ncbi:TPA: DUF2635 domain-containing protein [Citrobacter koseri]|uniref:Protein of uncharacterized function (DUF2635) n=1 Tax=Citrobacter koseri TaxID=545 RepID=A0A447UW22_CITKO|nr:Protein of uncharacterised function (DUF2635) [Citrobacter koseri]VEB94889.1 Protein of uncharacterised function (DUF2635) [Citrobacter koseri]HEM6672555.1 DUF2635 domain-containing protein [Citrobacter koseri]
MNKKLIKPARPGLRVRKADGSLLNADGEILAVAAYWRRRESEGDVVITAPSKPKSGKADKEA